MTTDDYRLALSSGEHAAICRLANRSCVPPPNLIGDSELEGETPYSSFYRPQVGLSVADSAELFGVSVATVPANLRQGTLAGEKFGGTWVVYLAGIPLQPTPSPSGEPAPLPVSDRLTQRSPSLVGTLGRLLLQGHSYQPSPARARIPRS
jgi:hypothetical protein